MSQAQILEFCRDVTNTLHDRTKHLSVDKILSDLSGLTVKLENFSLYVRQKKFFKADTEFWPQLDHVLLPHLSFSIKNGVLVRFSNPDECASQYLSEKEIVRYEAPNAVVKSSKEIVDDLVVKEIANTVNLIYHVNVFDDIVEASAVRLAKLMLSNNDSYSIENLLECLARNYIEVDGLSLITLKKEKDEFSFSEKKDFGESVFSNLSKKILSLMECSIKSKRIRDGFEKIDENININYVCIPVIEQFGRGFADSDILRCVLIFSLNNEVDEFLVRFSHLGVQGAIEAKGRNLQIAILHDLDTLKRDVISMVRRGDLRSEQSRERFIQPKLSEIVSRVLDATAAHSVTVRTFDPFEDSLNIFSESQYMSGKYNEIDDCSISTSMKGSANVHCFLTCEPGTHIYLPDLSSDAILKPTQPHEHNPRRSLCEACFPIWKAGIPFGTFNVEGAERSSLAGDIPFLGWVASQIGDLFSTVSELIPTDAIAQLSKANELAHGSLRHGAEFSPESISNLTQSTRSTINAWAKFESDFRKPVDTGEDSRDGVNLRSLILTELKSAVTDKVWRTLNTNWMVPIKNEIISPLEAENVRGILKAILSNADLHSRIADDHLRIFVLWRGGARCLFIKYKSLFRSISCNEASYFGTLPVIKEGKVRYGAFLMGQRVRAANGILIVRRPTLDQTGFMPLELVVGLPIRLVQ